MLPGMVVMLEVDKAVLDVVVMISDMLLRVSSTLELTNVERVVADAEVEEAPLGLLKEQAEAF